MDVDRFSFSSQLGALLEAIAKAHFVAFDLELSGIQSRQFSLTDAPHGGKHTLQERYVDLKAAAERYQVLQVGLTCVEQDSETGALQRCLILDVGLITHSRHLHFASLQLLSKPCNRGEIRC